MKLTGFYQKNPVSTAFRGGCDQLRELTGFDWSWTRGNVTGFSGN